MKSKKANNDIKDNKIDPNINHLLDFNLRDVGFSVWVRQSLNEKKIFTIKELVTKTEAELLSIKYFDEICLDETKYILKELGLQLNMNIGKQKTEAKKENSTTMNSYYEIEPKKIKDYENEEKLPDIRDKGIEELELPIRSYHCLKKVGINTIRELNEKKDSDLLKIKNFGVTCLQDVRKALKKYTSELNMNSGDKDINFSNQDEQNFYILISKDLREFDFSVRVMNCFKDNKIRKVRDLITKTENDLLSLKNFGQTCLNETLRILKQIGLHLDMDTMNPFKKENSIPLFTDSKIKINESKIAKINLVQESVNNFPFSNRAINVLEKMNINNLYELLNTPFEKIMEAKNCGVNTSCEIREVVSEYINSEENFISCSSIYDWLIYARKKFIESGHLEIIFPEKKYLEVFKRRYGFGMKAETLESIGTDLSLTRERIRQISIKSIEIIINSLSPKFREYLNCIVSEFRKNNCFLPYTGNDIIIQTKEFSLLNSLLSFLDKKIVFDEELKVWRDKYFKILNKIELLLDKNFVSGKNYEKLDIEDFAEKIVDNLDLKKNCIHTVAKIIVKNYFKKIGNEYFFKKIDTVSLCSKLIKSRFPKGIALYKDTDKFLSAAENEGFGDLFKNKNKRALIGLILRSPDLALWDWGVYTHIDNIHFNKELLGRVASWLNERFKKGIPKISLWGAFKKFTNECLESGIPNEHALYSCMKLNYENKFSFLKDPYVYPAKTTKRIKKGKLLENFLLNKGGIVTHEELERNLGLKDYQFIQLIEESDKLLFLGKKELIHQDNINFNQEDFLYMEKCIEKELKVYDYISIDIIFNNNIVICKNNGIERPLSLYNVFAHFKSNKFYFPRYPHIVSQKNSIEDDGRFSFNDIINHFFLSKNSIVYRKQLFDYFVNERGYKERIIDAIPNFCENIIKYTNSSYISLETINWSEEKSELLQIIAKNRFEKDVALGKPYSLIQDLLEEELPIINESINITWQKALLKELLGKQENIKILGSMHDIFIITPNEYDIKSENDLVYYILLNNFDGATNIDRFINYLKKSRILGKLNKNNLDKNIKISNEEIYIKTSNKC